VNSLRDQIVHLTQELRGERAMRRQWEVDYRRLEAENVWLRARLNAYLAAEMLELKTEILERRPGNLRVVDQARMTWCDCIDAELDAAECSCTH
jgi:hypothetical protein